MLKGKTECMVLKSQKCKLLVNSANWKKRPWAAHQFGRTGRLPWLSAHCLCGSWGWQWGQERDGCGRWEPFPKASGHWEMVDSSCVPGASALQPVGLASKRKALLSAASYQRALLAKFHGLCLSLTEVNHPWSQWKPVLNSTWIRKLKVLPRGRLD